MKILLRNILFTKFMQILYKLMSIFTHLMTMLQVSSMWSWVTPAIRQALTHISPETIRDWGTSFATSCDDRDPNR